MFHTPTGYISFYVYTVYFLFIVFLACSTTIWMCGMLCELSCEVMALPTVCVFAMAVFMCVCSTVFVIALPCMV